MSDSAPQADSGPADAREFRTTHWSMVLLAGAKTDPESGQALETLCRTYWFPVYAFIRRKGHDVEESRDLTQEFFTRLLSKNYLVTADPQKGRFRTFLLTAVTRFLANEWDRAQALKRGGGQSLLSLDANHAEERYQLEPVDALAPDMAFEQRWAEQVLAVVMDRLKTEFQSMERGERFEVLKAFLAEDKGTVSYAEAAAKLGLTEATVRMGIYRMRHRYGELLREEIGHTVVTTAEIDEEIRYLLKVLSE